MAQPKIAIIGSGSIAATCAFALLLKNFTAELLLVDPDDQHELGEILDLSDTSPLSVTSKLTKASFSQAATADIIVILAGQVEKIGQDNVELFNTNKRIIDNIFLQLTPLNQNAIIILASEPVDLLTYYVQKKSLLNQNQVIGTGTCLESIRLLIELGAVFEVSSDSIHGFVLGEHGESQFTAWSSVLCDGKAVASFTNISEKNLEHFERQIKEKSHQIMAAKGIGVYGIATCITLLCESVIFNRKRIFSVSCFYKPFDLCLSVPCVIGASGIEKIITISLSKKEKDLLSQAAERIRQAMKRVNLE